MKTKICVNCYSNKIKGIILMSRINPQITRKAVAFPTPSER